MPPSLESLEQLNIEIPEYPGASHPFSKGRPKFYQIIPEPVQGRTGRTHFFEKHFVGIYLALGRPVPYAFRTKNGSIRSLDAGCIKFLVNRATPEAELIYDKDRYIVAARPLPPLLQRFGSIQNTLIKPYAALVRTLNLPFDITSPVDERRRVLSEQVRRDGADLFRKTIFSAWGSRCAISRIDVREVLEAAHIFPYLGATTNDPRNGILLKSDLHKLFDSSLISFEYDEGNLAVRVSKHLAATGYAKYNGKIVRLPADLSLQPANEVVEHHFSNFKAEEAKA